MKGKNWSEWELVKATRPRFPSHPRPMGGDWSAWGCLTVQNPNSGVGEDGRVRPEQAPFINQMIFQNTRRA